MIEKLNQGDRVKLIRHLSGHGWAIPLWHEIGVVIKEDDNSTEYIIDFPSDHEWRTTIEKLELVD
jgi:hypothetical protein